MYITALAQSTFSDLRNKFTIISSLYYWNWKGLFAHTPAHTRTLRVCL